MAKGRKTGGRQKGSVNKSTAEIKLLAQKYSARVIEELAKLAGVSDADGGKAESEQARIAAMKELMDRGHGKPTQAIVGGDDTEEPIKLEHAATDELISRIARIAGRASKR